MKKAKFVTGLVFLGLICVISLAGWTTKDLEFSENENRYLASFPKVSWKKIMSGDFQNDFEDYLNDHIILRNGWITAKTAIQKTCHDTDIGGAYVGKDGYDFEKILPEDVDDELVAKNTQAVTAYFDYCSDWIEPERISFMLVPTSGLILEEKLPDHAILFAQENYMDEIRQSIEDYNFMDVRQILQEHNQEYIYYKTDHHWTTDGAYWAYQQWCSQTGHTFREKDQYEELTVTDAFRGSLYSKILDYDSAYDQIHVLQPVGEQESYEVVADGIDIGGFYQEDKLEQKDKYAYFFGGNYGEVRITNTALVQSKQNHTKERNLLVIKDSFANTFVPLIAQEYDHVYMVDLRYYNNDMAGYISENNITDILVLYNVSNFISDKNIYKLISNIPE